MDEQAFCEALRSGVSKERLSRYLDWFAGVQRDTGGSGEEAAAHFIADTLTDLGVPVTMHSFDAYLSYPRSAHLEALGSGERAFKALTHSFAASTPDDGLEGEMAFVDMDSLTSARGKIACLKGLLSPNKVLSAQQAGAIGVVFTSDDWFVHNMIATTVWGTPGPETADRRLKIPVLSVSRETGEWLRGRPEPLRVRLHAEVDTGWRKSLLPEVRIEGGDEPDRFVLVGAHYCAWHEGITDNATGDATLLELARILWEHRAGLKRSVRICWWPGHSHGRYSGSTWYADQHFLELSEGCLAYHNIDSPGVKGATRYVARHTSAELEAFVQEIAGEITGQQLEAHRPAKSADQSFLGMGVSSFSCYPFLQIDDPDYRPWTGGAGNAWWWHTEYDTRDKADVDILAVDTGISLTLLARLLNAHVLPFDFRRTADEIEEWITAYAEATRDHVHSDLPAAARDLKEAAERFHRADAPAQQKNAALIAAGRELTPVLYARGDRFHHDPADRVPRMVSAGMKGIFPGLQFASDLPGLKGTESYGFLRTQLVREQNRVSQALRCAAEALSV